MRRSTSSTRRCGSPPATVKRRTLGLMPARSIADLWAWFTGTLRELGIGADLWDKPRSERTSRRSRRTSARERSYPELGRSWFGVLTELQGVFDEWRAPFFGRSTVSFWWGGFDFTVVLFNGRHAAPRQGSDYIMRYDLDAEHLSAGFWPGDHRHEPMLLRLPRAGTTELRGVPVGGRDGGVGAGDGRVGPALSRGARGGRSARSVAGVHGFGQARGGRARRLGSRVADVRGATTTRRRSPVTKNGA